MKDNDHIHGGDNLIIIPIETSRKLKPSSRYEITILVNDLDKVSNDIDYSRGLFKLIRRDLIGSEDSFQIGSAKQNSPYNYKLSLK